MRFYVGLVNNVHSKPIANVVEADLMWVVRATNRVEVIGLHQPNIRFDLIERFEVTRLRVMFMLIYTPNEQRFSIELKLSTLYFDSPKTNLRRFTIYELPMWRQKRNDKAI